MSVYLTSYNGGYYNGGMNEDILLEKMTRKAFDNGWTADKFRDVVEKENPNLFNIIFSHSFAKAFWGEDFIQHLQIMVQEEEPLKYIEKFV